MSRQCFLQRTSHIRSPNEALPWWWFRLGGVGCDNINPDFRAFRPSPDWVLKGSSQLQKLAKLWTPTQLIPFFVLWSPAFGDTGPCQIDNGLDILKTLQINLPFSGIPIKTSIIFRGGNFILARSQIIYGNAFLVQHLYNGLPNQSRRSCYQHLHTIILCKFIGLIDCIWDVNLGLTYLAGILWVFMNSIGCLLRYHWHSSKLFGPQHLPLPRWSR